MRTIFCSKKGVSPLIATILLIAFAVALGSVVMNWGLNLDLVKSGDKCRNLEIKIRNIDGNQVCFGGFGQNGYINFILDNAGVTDVSGLTILIYGEKGTKLFELNNILIKKGSLYDKKDKEVIYDFSTFGKIKRVEFQPKIKDGSEIEVCGGKYSIIAEKIASCT